MAPCRFERLSFLLCKLGGVGIGKIVLEGLTAMSVALSPITITITNIIRTSFLFIDLGLVLLVKINASGIRFRDAKILNLPI